MCEVRAAAQTTEMTSPSAMAPHESSMVTAAPSSRRTKSANTGAKLKLYMQRLRCLLCPKRSQRAALSVPRSTRLGCGREREIEGGALAFGGLGLDAAA